MAADHLGSLCIWWLGPTKYAHSMVVATAPVKTILLLCSRGLIAAHRRMIRLGRLQEVVCVCDDSGVSPSWATPISGGRNEEGGRDLWPRQRAR